MVVTEYTPQTSLKLAKSDTYWDKDAVRYGGLNLVAVTANDQLAGVNAGREQVDMAPATVQLMPSLGVGQRGLRRREPQPVDDVPDLQDGRTARQPRRPQGHLHGRRP